MAKFAAILVLLGLAPLGAQNPNQYPPGPTPQPGTYPPGTYPGQYPGQYPGGGGISIPKGKGKKQQNQNTLPTFSQDGMVVSNDGKKLVIATTDGRTIWFALTPITKFTRSAASIAATAVVPRTTVHVDALADEEQFLTAIQVDLLKDAVKDAPAAPGAIAEAENRPRPNSVSDAPVDAPDRPILRRGKPKSADSDEADSITMAKPSPKKESGGDFTIAGDSDQVKLARTGDDLIDRTKEWAMTFTNGLPNYVCQQNTTRYVEQSRSSGWDPLDIVTAKVIYEDGKESYREITVGGKRTNKSMMELGGSTSTGEFASTLRSLFAEFSQAQFKLNQSTRIRETPAAIYDFKVALRNSDWTISAGSQTLRPAYSGGVWIEKGSAQVRRIEMQADNIPKNFPLDSMEWTVDYEEIPLGTGKFLLPVHAENLACWRGTSICTKNATDFRDYHKFSGESTITFGK